MLLREIFSMAVFLFAISGICRETFSFTALSFPEQGGKVKNQNGILTLALEGKGRCAAEAQMNLSVPAQYKLAFTVQEKGGRGALLSVRIATKKNGKSVFSPWKKVSLYPLEQNVVLGLDSEFGLSDGMWQMSSIQFLFESLSAASAEVKDIRVVSSDSLAGNSVFRVVPAGEKRVFRPRPDATCVYFEFDNDDLRDSVRVQKEVLYDPPSWSFREMLLENAEREIRIVKSPEEADVIVYSRARPGAAPNLAELVRKGRRLIVYGNPADSFLEPLMPLRLTPAKSKGFVPRVKAKLVKAHPLIGDRKTGEGDFGRYFTAELVSGDVLLAGEDGQPLLAERKNVLQFAVGIGCALLEDDWSKAFYDPLLLRAILGNNPEKLERIRKDGEALLASERKHKEELIRSIAGTVPGRSWRVGMSEQNMGRFGWQIGEGLACGVLESDLSVSNGQSSFRFVPDEGKKRFPVEQWRLRAVSGKVTLPDDGDPLSKWSGIGTVEYSASIKFDPAWRGKNITFEVEKGIDDLDETFFNGVRIGNVDRKTSNYWNLPRRYEIPERAVRWGKVNRLVVRNTNLREKAGFGSQPLIVVTDRNHTLPTLAVESISWTSKKYRVSANGKRMGIHLSLLTPFTLFEFESPLQHLALKGKSVQCAAYSTRHGIRICRLSGRSVFYERRKDGAWNAPWLLLFRASREASHPLLLVFDRQPEKLTASGKEGMIQGIGIAMRSRSFSVAAGWPWGITPIRTDWRDRGLPDNIREHIARCVNMTLNFPVGCDEIFSLDREKQEIEIVNRFRFLPRKDEWNTRLTPFAALPPLTGFAVSRNFYGKALEPYVDFGINTLHGPMLGVAGRDTIRYRLPLPPEDDLVPVNVDAENELRDTINDLFAGGNRWSWGGGLRREELTPEYPMSKRKEPEIQNITLFGWCFGLTIALQGSLFLNGENRAALCRRASDRFLAPIELYQYKSYGCFRKEPFSDLKYPIVFPSIYRLSTGFTPGFGSRVQYGDNNEACTVAAWIGEQLANRFGQAGVIRSNWNWFRQVMRYQFMIDDYAFHSGSCRESGAGGWIDMLNGEFAGMLYYARLARIAGDTEEEEQGLYRAAKKLVPTLVRFRFCDYLRKVRPDLDLAETPHATGFCEDSLKLIRFPRPATDYNFINAMDFFDFSQGAPGVLYRHYHRYVLPEVTRYLETYAVPELTGNGLRLGSAYLQPLAVFGPAGIPLREWMNAVIQRDGKKKKQDWPGIRCCQEFGLWLWRTNGKIALADCRLLDVRSAIYLPVRKVLLLNCVSAPSGLLRISSENPVREVIRNGKLSSFQPLQNGRTEIPLVPGNNELEIRF